MMKCVMRARIFLASAVCVLSWCGVTMAQGAGAGDRPARGGESLDDLLQITPVKPTTEKPAVSRSGENEMKERLTQENSTEAMVLASKEMEIAWQRLMQQRDAGVQTQRLQQQIIARLDQVIATAKQQQSSSSSSSSSDSSDQSQSGEKQNDGDRGSEKNQSGQNGKNQPGPNSPGKNATAATGNQSVDGANTPPKQGQPNAPMQATRSEWGNLPPRVREELSQGLHEPFSPIYKEMTEAYYKRLAQEQK